MTDCFGYTATDYNDILTLEKLNRRMDTLMRMTKNLQGPADMGWVVQEWNRLNKAILAVEAAEKLAQEALTSTSSTDA